MNIQELKKKMEHVPDHKMHHHIPMTKSLHKGKHHDLSKGMAPKGKALKNAKTLSVNPSWMPIRSERAAIHKKNGESEHHLKRDETIRKSLIKGSSEHAEKESRDKAYKQSVLDRLKRK